MPARTLFTDDANASTARPRPTLTRPADRGSREFELELRKLFRARLSGELGFEAFAEKNLELHFRFGRTGYTRTDYERDMAAHQERSTRTQADGPRPIRWIADALDSEADGRTDDGSRRKGA